ncbi:MAG: TIGR00266 family protein [Chloroflexi bacterium AL-W]|nr:TIGR00266 family protein [Chloroflexi bacterium AL-N1]NOK66129.1 TIGR00266 family protein [Chloroflexi bacterium AL-N10]NOK73010.1 TIGR00266 family protein [Chloroflexi bacterium AL-N5]NOK79907.1 TIGR00266 family protein [Chloroflexi bacterium AL-W]NOK88237.1 TIGR00266 family protein [Chloroflexi bacterium AL-N15]
MTDYNEYSSQPGERIDLPDPQIVQSGTGHSGMNYQIVGTTMQAAVIQLNPGQTLYSESGGMSWMSGNVDYSTTTGGGGLGGIFKRAISGESLFIVEYTCSGVQGLVAFASEFPGKIVPLHLGEGQQVIAQKDAFMCAEKSVNLEMHFRRKLGSGFFGGEGFIMQKLTGPGVAFVEMDGEIVEYTLQAGQVLKVDTGHVAMYEPSVDFDIEMVRGFRNILFGGEGLFLATLRGPGRVWLQTMPAMKLAKKVMQFAPSSGDSGGSGGINLGNLLNND